MDAKAKLADVLHRAHADNPERLASFIRDVNRALTNPGQPDDLDRILCPHQGKEGHAFCGYNWEKGQPNFGPYAYEEEK